MALILCIEAGTDIASVALAEDGVLLSVKYSAGDREHARNLALFTRDILQGNGITVKDLAAVAVGKGPGSYTGLRIAVSLAKGLCYGGSLPLIAVSSLEAMVYTALDAEAGIIEGKQPMLLPMIDARRMEVYCQLFDAEGKPLGEIDAHIINENSFAVERKAGSILLFGNGAEKCRAVFTGENVIFSDILPSASGLVKPAWEAYKAGIFEDAAYFEPFYLKDFVVTTSAKRIF